MNKDDKAVERILKDFWESGRMIISPDKEKELEELVYGQNDTKL
uniref:Uncharacterized protein n=1 Tax=viral metagenome TaxID=1070528 RepID=A0A6H2A5M8_9ZZZZ